MSRTTQALFTGTTVLALAACADFMGSNGGSDPLMLEPVFQTVPLGFSANSSSFDSSGDPGVAFLPGPMGSPLAQGHDGGTGGDSTRRDGDHRGEGDKRDGFGGPGLRGLLMGGGLGPDFLGRIPFGKGLGRGPFAFFRLPDTCVFDAASGRVECPDKVHGVLTVTSSFQFKDAGGTVQAKFDTASTDLVNVQVTVTGTKVRRPWDADSANTDSAVTAVDHASDRTVSGLAPGSTQRTINGTAHASEVTEGVKDGVAFVAERLATDSTRGLVIAIGEGRPTIPKAGVIIRTMSVKITPEGGTPRSKSRREEITFDGSNVVKIVITQNGETKTCTITLPGKKLVCD